MSYISLPIAIGKPKVLQSEELRWYLGITVAAVVLIGVNVCVLSELGLLLKDVFFTVSSVLTTTAYTTVNLITGRWLTPCCTAVFDVFSGMSGSTISGLKWRAWRILKSIRRRSGA